MRRHRPCFEMEVMWQLGEVRVQAVLFRQTRLIDRDRPGNSEGRIGPVDASVGRG